MIHTRGSGRSREPAEYLANCVTRSWASQTHLDGVLVLPGEGVDGSLLDTLLALREALVPEEGISIRTEGQVWEGTKAYFPTAMIANRVSQGS